MIAAIKIPEPYNDAAIKEMIAKVPVYNDKELREMIAKTTKDFETVLAVADKNIAETRKTLETRIAELDKENKNLKETVAVQEKKLQETAILSENTADKLSPEFKGKAKGSVERSGLPNLVKPY
jgi:hypothetical protein